MEQCSPMTAAASAQHAAPPAARPSAQPRSHYRRFMALTTRWMDNDAYGHLNNVVYYSLFDTVVNLSLIHIPSPRD